MYSSAMEDGSPIRGRSLMGREVKGIGESRSVDDFFVLSPLFISNS